MGNFWMGIVGRESLIAPDDTFGLLFIMCAGVFLSIYLEQKYNWASKASGAVIALFLAMFLANVGILPLSSTLYDDIVWGVVVPLSIPILLNKCDLRRIGRESGKMLIVYLAGAVGTTLGAILAYHVLKGPFGNAEDMARCASIMTGSYSGGGVNFAAMASQYAAGEDLTAALTVADNLMMGIYFFVLIAFAGMRIFRNHYPHPSIDAVEAGAVDREAGETIAAAFWGRKEISLKDIAVNVAYASGVVWASRLIAGIFGGMEATNGFMDFVVKFLGSQYVWITTISVIFATFCSKKADEMNGSQEIGTYLIYWFLFVIGVPANLYTVLTKSPLLLIFTALIIVVNMIFCFGAAKIFKCSLEDAIIASNANIGGPPTACGMAISQGWVDLAGPGLLMGVLGYVIGNYLGVFVATALGL